MRILLVHQYFMEKDGTGGTRFNEMAEAWAHQGHQVTVLAGMGHFATGKKPPKYKGLNYFVDDYAPGVTVIRCHVSESYNVNFLGRLWAYFSFVFSSIWGGMKYAKGRHDLVLVTSPPLFVGITGLFFAWTRRIPMLFEVRDLWPESAIDTGVLKSQLIIRLAYWFEGFIYRRAAKVNTLTPAFFRILRDRKGQPESKLLMIPNAADFSYADALDTENFDPEAFREENELPQDHFIITYVGAHGVANHLIQVLETAKILEKEKVLFLLIGDGMTKPKLQQKAQDWKLENVRFIDSQPKKTVFRYLRASNAGASVLKNVDTFNTVYSNKTFDYMACRLPILMAIGGVSKELVEKAECGLYVRPENPEDFAAKIRELRQSPEKARTMGEKGHNYARQHFDRQKLALQYLEELQKISRS